MVVSRNVDELYALATEGLAAAAYQPRPRQRFAAAHLAALRAAAAVVADRAPASGQRRICSVWQLLARMAPELAEWASFFESGATKGSAAVAGRAAVTIREADDLLRDSVTFVELVAEVLGISTDRVIRVDERLAVR